MSRNLNLKKNLILASLYAILAIIDHPMAIAVNESNSNLCNALFTGSTTPESTTPGNTSPYNRSHAIQNILYRSGPTAVELILTRGINIDRANFTNATADRLLNELSGPTSGSAPSAFPLRPFGDPATRAAALIPGDLAMTLYTAHRTLFSETTPVESLAQLRASEGIYDILALETNLNALLDPQLVATVRIEFPGVDPDTQTPRPYRIHITIHQRSLQSLAHGAELEAQIMQALTASPSPNYGRLTSERMRALATSRLMQIIHAINLEDGHTLTSIEEAPANGRFNPRTGELELSRGGSLGDHLVRLKLTYTSTPAAPNTNPPLRVAYLTVRDGRAGAYHVVNSLSDVPPASIMQPPANGGPAIVLQLSTGALEVEPRIFQAPTTPQPLQAPATATPNTTAPIPATTSSVPDTAATPLTPTVTAPASTTSPTTLNPFTTAVPFHQLQAIINAFGPSPDAPNAAAATRPPTTPTTPTPTVMPPPRPASGSSQPSPRPNPEARIIGATDLRSIMHETNCSPGQTTSLDNLLRATDGRYVVVTRNTAAGSTLNAPETFQVWIGHPGNMVSNAVSVAEIYRGSGSTLRLADGNDGTNNRFLDVARSRNGDRRQTRLVDGDNVTPLSLITKVRTTDTQTISIYDFGAEERTPAPTQPSTTHTPTTQSQAPVVSTPQATVIPQPPAAVVVPPQAAAVAPTSTASTEKTAETAPPPQPGFFQRIINAFTRRRQ